MATKVSNGRYKATVFIGLDENDKRKYKAFYAQTADEADFLALEFKIKKKKQEDPCQMTLGEAIDQYIASKDAVLSPRTIDDYKKIKQNRFRRLMKMQLSKIDSTTFQKAINDEIKLGGERKKQLAPKTIKNAVTLIIATMNFFEPDKRIKITLPKASKKQYATPNGEELAKIIKAAEGTDIEIPILLASWLSLRAGEICGLKWTDIKGNYIDINETRIYVNGQQISKDPKTVESKRKILLPEYIKNKIYTLPQTDKYIINLKGKDITYRFTKLLENNGLPHCRFHDLRHANASIMLMLGVPDKYAQERGGWASNNILKSVYQQTFDDEQQRIAEKIDNYFNELIKQ